MLSSCSWAGQPQDMMVLALEPLEAPRRHGFSPRQVTLHCHTSPMSLSLWFVSRDGSGLDLHLYDGNVLLAGSYIPQTQNMRVQISPLTEADIAGSVKAIQEAFADDPYNNWMFDKSKFSTERNSVSLAIRCRWGMRNALFYVAKEEGSDKVLGIAMWLRPQPSGQPQSWHDWIEDWRMWFNQGLMNLWYGRGGLNVKRYYIWKKAQDDVHSEVWKDPRGYYFLNIMVVLPEYQGHGIGRRLVTAVTDQADAEGMPCYLEASRDVPNIQIYERLGFQFVKKLVCDDDGEKCTLYTMVREPKPVQIGNPPAPST